MTAITMVKLRRTIPLLQTIFWVTALYVGAGVHAAVPNAKKAGPGDDIFNGKDVLRINITIPQNGMRLLGTTQWGPGRGVERPEVRATVMEGGRTYSDVAI